MSKKSFRFIVLCVSALALLFLSNGPISGRMRGEARQQRANPPAAAPTNSAEARKTTVIQRGPSRAIKDPYSAFSAVTVDLNRNEIILEDENNAQITVYDRLENTPP